MTFHVASEVGRLRQVILHRPGLEMERLTPHNREDLLFDELLWVSRAQQEHDRFAQVLRDEGVEVLYFSDLLREALAVPAARERVLDHTFDEEVIGPAAVGPLRAMADAMDDAELTTALVGGMTKAEALERVAEPSSVAFHVLGPDDFLLPPLPNHLYARDASAWVYDGVALSAMRKRARLRESVHYEAIYRWHPAFAADDFHLWEGTANRRGSTVEGGDVLVLGRGAVLVGMSERTTPQGVERLAKELFAAGAATTVVALAMPQQRAFMHLDTVMTMVDPESFTEYAGLGALPSYTITPGDDGDLAITDHSPGEMHDAIARALGLDRVRVLTPTQGVRAAQREQWDDGCNVLAVRPGVVIGYERNETSNAFLEANGIEVITVAGSEVGRGRGGPRCMSCPTLRDGI